ncbi:hypothetical protein EVAR_26898_1 [Eumeta japonica]|uniref:Uncharacterized protein n=1 Tax=Eumeta variegata TaxID=151549 RepID=A0A4C1VRM2_EUMVA|nr:hypothetical protein EVAR_26898_1 [Eumeta japonica]
MRIEGKVGATLTEWRDEEASWYSTLQLNLFCAVFQAEMATLQRAIRTFWLMKLGAIFPRSFWKARLCAYFGCAPSVQASSLDALPSPRRRTNYNKFPLLYAKKVIRVASLEKWQERYAVESTGEDNKRFFPRVKQAYRVLKQMEMTSQMVQTFTRHDRFAQYLHRFKLKDSPYCAFDPAKIQDVLNVLEEYQNFSSRSCGTGSGNRRRFRETIFLEIMEDGNRRVKFLRFCDKVVNPCTRLN